jgi:hypothetical protein
MQDAGVALKLVFNLTEDKDYISIAINAGLDLNSFVV